MSSDFHLINWLADGPFTQVTGTQSVHGQFSKGKPVGTWNFSGPDACGKAINVQIVLAQDGSGDWIIPGFGGVCGANVANAVAEYGKLIGGVKDGPWIQYQSGPDGHSFVPLQKGNFSNGQRQGQWYFFQSYALRSVATFQDGLLDGPFFYTYIQFSGSVAPRAIDISTASVSGNFRSTHYDRPFAFPNDLGDAHLDGDWVVQVNGIGTGGAHLVNGSGHYHSVDGLGRIVDGDLVGSVPDGIWTVGDTGTTTLTFQNGKLIKSEQAPGPHYTITSGPAPPAASAPARPAPAPAPQPVPATTCSIQLHVAACAAAGVGPHQDNGCSVTCHDPAHPAYCVPDTCTGNTYTQELCVCRQ